MTDSDRARLVGLNHVALPVGDAEAALEFYREVFTFELRGRHETAVFLDMGDQFLALMEADTDGTDETRHLGVVVDDREAVQRRIDDMDVEQRPGEGLDFRDPWGNRLQVVAYEAVQFTKADHVRAGMGIDDLEKTESAIAELAEKGLAPE